MTHRPKKIIVLRHAEKPTEGGNQRLSLAGVKRSGYITRWIPETFGQPTIIFATEPTNSSFRPLMTIWPLWNEVKDSLLDVSIEDDAALWLGHHLREGDIHHGALADAVVVVCWHHGKIPDLLKGMGVKHHEIPDPWPEDDFSMVFAVSFDDGPDAIVSKHRMSF